ncbi:hypothetical protein V4D07_12180 [Paenibacillus taichungensis]
MRCGQSINKRVSSSGFCMGSDKPIDYSLRIIGVISLWHMIDRAVKLISYSLISFKPSTQRTRLQKSLSRRELDWEWVKSLTE